MKWDYFYALLNPRIPVSEDYRAMLQKGRYRLHSMVALYDGMVFAVYEREMA